MEKSVLEATQHARGQMANRYNKRFLIQDFPIDSIVSLRIPKQDRSTLDLPQLYARIVAQPYKAFKLSLAFWAAYILLVN